MAYLKEAVSGVKWTTAVKITDVVLQLARVAIMARLLEKEAFGLLAIVNTVLGFTMIFSDLGLTVAMLHKQDITQKQYSSIYWFNWMLNAGIFLIVVVSAPFVASFYRDPRLTHLIILMGGIILTGPIGKIFHTIKFKNLEFGFISKTQIFTRFMGFVLIVAMLMLDMGIYSVVFGSLASSLASGLILSYAGRHQFKAQFYMNFSEIKDYFRIGAYELGTQILNQVAQKIDVILIGRFFGMDNLGIYNLGKELVLKPMKIFNPIIIQVAIPIFAKLQDDATVLKSHYIKVLNLVAFLNFPVFAWLFIMAEPIVALFYGEHLMEISFFVRVLSLWGMFASIGNPAGVLTIAKGRTDISFKWTIIRILIAPVVIFIASFYSIEAVAYSQVILQFVFFAAYWRILVFPLSGILFGEYVQAVTHSFICSMVAMGVVSLLLYFFSGDHLTSMIVGGFVFGISYLSTSWRANPQMFTQVKALVFKKKASA